MDKRAAIEAAYRRLPILEHKESNLKEMVYVINSIETGYEHYPGFKPCSKLSCQKELDKVGQLAEKLATAITELHEPTIRCLKYAGFAKPKFSSDRVILRELCEGLAEAAKKADVSLFSFKSGAGRPEKTIANETAKLLALHYKELTDRNPTISSSEVAINRNQRGYRSGGEFLEFVSNIFSLLAINSSAEASAKLAINEFRKAKEKIINKKSK